MPRTRDQKLLRALGRRVQEIRRRSDFTQEALAEAIEIQPTTLSRLEGGHRGLSLTQLWRIAAVLDVSLSELLDVDLEMPKPKEAKVKGETELLRLYRGLESEPDRNLVLRVARRVAK